MFQEYQNEIIAAIAILVLIVLYLIIKRKEKSKTGDIEELVIEDNNISEEVIPDPFESEVVEDEYDVPDLEGVEEGSFGEIQTQQSALKKRDVPPHGKITKENFKEFAGIRILVAEDNLINQKVITGLLADSGIELVIADDGQIVLDILEKDSNFLLILMDAHMPRVDGFEATRQIRQNPNYNHILIVALSGDTAADDIKKMQEAGMEEHLEKPLRMNDLYDILYAYADNFKASAQGEKEIVHAPQTQELNGAKGLDICGGDETFYHEILSEFVTNYASSAEQLSDMFHNDKLQDADKLLLDIIGVASNIGADPLHEIAQHLKISLKDTDEKSYFTLLEQYKAHLQTLIEDIKNYK